MGHCCFQCLTFKVLDYTINAKDETCTVQRRTGTGKCDVCGTNDARFIVSYYPKDPYLG